MSTAEGRTTPRTVQIRGHQGLVRDDAIALKDLPSIEGQLHSSSFLCLVHLIDTYGIDLH
jgi:hypothetical protein